MLSIFPYSDCSVVRFLFVPFQCFATLCHFEMAGSSCNRSIFGLTKTWCETVIPLNSSSSKHLCKSATFESTKAKIGTTRRLFYSKIFIGLDIHNGQFLFKQIYFFTRPIRCLLMLNLYVYVERTFPDRCRFSLWSGLFCSSPARYF
jgi:hypothetical protein